MKNADSSIIKLIICGSLIVVIIALLNLVADYFYYNDYKEKVDIINCMIASEEDIEDIAIKLMKGQKVELSEKNDFLKDNGFDVTVDSYYHMIFAKRSRITAGISIIGTFFLLLFLWTTYKTVKKRKKEIILEVENALLSFRTEGKKIENSDIKYCNYERINHELTAIKEYINMINEYAEMEKEETKSIVTDISHQLKTPVAVIDINYSLLSEPGISDEERTEFIGRIGVALRELELLLESLLKISKMETGLIELKKEENVLGDTVRNAVSCIYPKAYEKRIDIHFIDNDNISEIKNYYDEKWMCEAIINILDNAIKYSPEGSNINIELTDRTGFFRIEIEDEGIGIDKDEYHKVFNRFYRGSSDYVKNQSGSGVGLYLANKIVRMHEGILFVKEGKGTSDVPEKYPGTAFVIQVPKVADANK